MMQIQDASLNIRVTKALLAALRKQAAKRGVHLATVVREALEAKVDK